MAKQHQNYFTIIRSIVIMLKLTRQWQKTMADKFYVLGHHMLPLVLLLAGCNVGYNVYYNVGCDIW